MTSNSEEGKIRRQAKYRGLVLVSTGPGGYGLIDPKSGAPVHPQGVTSAYHLSLDDVRYWLQSDDLAGVTLDEIREKPLDP